MYNGDEHISTNSVSGDLSSDNQNDEESSKPVAENNMQGVSNTEPVEVPFSTILDSKVMQYSEEDSGAAHVNDVAAQHTTPIGAPVGAPAERTDAPVPEKLSKVNRILPSNNMDRSFAPSADEWSDPNYSQSYESTSSMYTPGIYVNPQYARKTANYDNGETSENKAFRVAGSRSAIVKIACLILVCVILSGAASYWVMEFRFKRGDFTVVNEVVLGGSIDGQFNNGLSTPISNNRTGMSAEDIYVMACSQVVSITTNTEGMGGAYNGVIPNSSSAVAGSGFIISRDGYILTNYHVVETAYRYSLPLTVSLIDGSTYDAKVVGYEASNDVALVKITATGLNPVVFADSDYISVGQTVYAVGNPLGELVYTMTDGIVSARDREVSVEGKIINTFQFSAAVNSGNSGGPLYDAYGEVIGIVTAKPMRASVEGIGFAIPINDAMLIATELISHGYISGRPLIGISGQTVTSAHADYWGWVEGTRVMSVNEGSAAERAGLIVGDIIIMLGDTEVDSMDSLRFALRRYRAGDTASMIVWRDGDEVEIEITFDEDLNAGQLGRN